MAWKLVLALTTAWAISATEASVVRRGLRHKHNLHTSHHPVILITNNWNGTSPETGADPQQGCGTAVPATADDMKYFHARCPNTCPLYVEDTTSGNNKFCDFACVSNSIKSCKEMNPMTPVADPVTGVCRRCNVVGCRKCNSDGTERCAECMEGYQLMSNGRCGYTWGYYIAYCAVILLLVVVAFLVIIVICWLIELGCRETLNEEGLHHALDVRSRSKMHMPKKKRFLPASSLKSTDKPGEYEVVVAGNWLSSTDEQKPMDKQVKVGDIVTGSMEDGWFRKDTSRKLWPLTTNLCREDVAGPGVTLLFNFQAAIIIWALVILVVWKLVASYTDEVLLTLGTKAAETDRQNCIVVHWGYEEQHRLMYVKVGFLLFTYLFSFIGAIIFGIRQFRIYTSDNSNTHRDFCVVLKGLPQIPGHVLVEDHLKEQIQAATGKTVMGVSVGWEAKDKYEDFQTAMSFVISDLEARDGSLTPQNNTENLEQSGTPREEDTQTDTGLTNIQTARSQVHKWALKVEGLFIHPATQALMTRGRQKKDLTSKEQTDEDKETSFLGRPEPSGATSLSASVVSLNTDLLTDAVKELHTASTAFVIFESEFSRDEAFASLKQNGMEFRFSNERGEEETCQLWAKTPEYEPQSVLWENLSSERSWVSIVKRVGWMLGVIVLTCMFLATFEYGYAIIQINNARSSGEEGITLSFLMFTGLVCAMMAGLCAISALVADMAMFERVGHRETCFVLLYTFSVVLQVSLDAVIGYFVGKSLMDANGIRTHDGTLIEDLNTEENFTEIFESYAMQKHIGVTILSFGFPCAFLVPFLIEPIASIYLPYKIMSWLVGSHPELKGTSAEGYLEAVPMDLGRYGDCMINVIIASMILWFPSGFNQTMFTFLLCSHCYIYLYDHYRLLRSVASIYIASYSVDFWAQWIFSIPCAIICGALTFKLNCEPYMPRHFPGMELNAPGFHDKPWGTHCDHGSNVWLKVALAFFGHIAVHTCALLCIVEFCGKDTSAAKDHSYKDTAERIPCSWFSANLIHCLRSKYVYAHDPPQDMCVSGKEHIMRLNPKIGAFFKDEKAECEDYAKGLESFRKSLASEMKSSPQCSPR